jgi:AraC-like DNA-binding protein
MDERLRAMVASGASVRQMAAELGVSPTTVRRRLFDAGLSTVRAEQRRAAGEARASLADDADLRCPVHGLTRHRRRPRGSFACLKCRAESVARRRRKVKAMLVAEAGGACVACGYDRCVVALHFHHVVPDQKRFSLSHQGVTRSLERARTEARKCVLLCGNCHAEVEAGLRRISPTLTALAADHRGETHSGVAQLAVASDC